MCGVPLGQDPRHYALTKVHGVPNDIKYLDLYPGYTKKKACDDVKAWRAEGEPVHRVTQFHKVLRGSMIDDPRMYVFKKVYRLSAAEIDEIKDQDFYTDDMALKELDHQDARRAGIIETRFRYDPSRSVRFTNVKRNFVYKKGRKGVVTGYPGYRPNAPDFVQKKPRNPKRKTSKKNVWAQAYAQGLANAEAQRRGLSRRPPVRRAAAASRHAAPSARPRPRPPPRPRPRPRPRRRRQQTPAASARQQTPAASARQQTPAARQQPPAASARQQTPAESGRIASWQTAPWLAGLPNAIRASNAAASSASSARVTGARTSGGSSR